MCIFWHTLDSLNRRKGDSLLCAYGFYPYRFAL